MAKSSQFFDCLLTRFTQENEIGRNDEADIRMGGNDEAITSFSTENEASTNLGATDRADTEIATASTMNYISGVNDAVHLGLADSGMNDEALQRLATQFPFSYRAFMLSEDQTTEKPLLPPSHSADAHAHTQNAEFQQESRLPTPKSADICGIDDADAHDLYLNNQQPSPLPPFSSTQIRDVHGADAHVLGTNIQQQSPRPSLRSAHIEDTSGAEASTFQMKNEHQSQLPYIYGTGINGFFDLATEPQLQLHALNISENNADSSDAHINIANSQVQSRLPVPKVSYINADRSEAHVDDPRSQQSGLTPLNVSQNYHHTHVPHMNNQEQPSLTAQVNPTKGTNFEITVSEADMYSSPPPGPELVRMVQEAQAKGEFAKHLDSNTIRRLDGNWMVPQPCSRLVGYFQGSLFARPILPSTLPAEPL